MSNVNRAVTNEVVIEHIRALLGHPAERVTPATRVSDLIADSFAMVDLAVDLQEEFAVILTREAWQAAVTVGDVTRLVCEQSARRAQP